MARPREFDEEQALDRALETFRARGYDGTSLQDLLDATGLARQSLYNAFGEKHALYLKVLARYQDTSTRCLDGAFASCSVKEGFRAVFNSIVEEPDESKRRGCLMVNAATELASHDVEVADVVARNLQVLERLFTRALEKGVASKELALPRSRIAPTARFLVGALQGLRVLAKTDPRSPALADMVRVTLEVLDR